MADHVILHLAPAADGWTIAKEGRRSLIAWAARREDALERARRELLKHPNGVLQIHGEDYAVQEELRAEELAGRQPHGSAREE